MTAPTPVAAAIFHPGALATLFQPIFRVRAEDRRLFALEALTRGPRGTNLAAADVLFEYTRRKGLQVAVDRLCVETALAEAAELPRAVPLTVNVHAATLNRDAAFPDYLAELAAAGSRATSSLIVEIVEHAGRWNGPGLQRSLAALRSLGVRIALDDIGVGESNFGMILDCHPDVLKVARSIVGGCRADERRRAVLESIVGLAASLGCQVVAEGIEDAADLQTVIDLGIDMAQGFLLASPAPARRLEGLWPTPG